MVEKVGLLHHPYHAIDEHNIQVVARKFMKTILSFLWSLFKYPFSPNKRKLWEWAEQADEKDVDGLIGTLEDIVKEKEKTD